MKIRHRLLPWMGSVVVFGTILIQSSAQESADPKTIRKNPRVNNQAETGVMLADVRPEKIFYRQGESVTGVVTLSNPTPSPRPVRVRAWLEQGMDQKAGVQTQDVTAEANRSRLVTFVWPAKDIAPYGQALAAELLVGEQAIASGRDYFASADSVWKVAIGALPNGPAANSANYLEEQITGQIRQFRDLYCNVWEKYFWAPDDWGCLTNPPGATWYSGQARRHENTEKLKLQVDASRALGITVVTYGKCMAGGAPGWELARARPHWFLTDVSGRSMGRPADVWDLDHWQEADRYKYEEYRYNWTYRWVDLRRLDALDHGIDQLIASTRQYGWDGVRFDSGGFRAHFVDGLFGGNDAVNTRNMKRAKERLWKAYPNYLFGFNTDNTGSRDGRAYPLTVGEMSHEMREMLAGGGLWMGEAIKSFANGSVQYATWSQFARDERRCVQAVREAGGHFCYLYSRGAPVRNLYQFVIGLIIGAHPYGGEHAGLPGSPDWGCFMTRWSGLIWDPRLRALTNAESSVTVTFPRPVWWKEFANERITGPDRRQVIVHLLNPPVDDAIASVLKELTKDVIELANKPLKKADADKEESLNSILDGDADAETNGEQPQLSPELLALARAQLLPEPVGQGVVRVRVPSGQKPLSAWILTPESPDRAAVTDWKPEKSEMVVSVPGFALWSIVVCEFEGTFEPVVQTPFSEPLNATEIAELRRQEPPAMTDVPWFGLRPPSPTPNVPSVEDAPAFDAAGPPVTPEKKSGAGSVPAGLRPGGEEGPDILIVNGFYHSFHRVSEAVKSAAPQARISTCTTRDLPGTHEALFAYDVIVLVNMPASAWQADGQQALADFVEAGGRLAVLGGPFTLGQGDFRDSPLEPVLPVRLLSGRDVFAMPRPLALGSSAGATFPNRFVLHYLHVAQPREGATVRAWAGERPVLVDWKKGRGSVVVFLGAPMGERQDNEIPFWEAPEWPLMLGRALLGR